MDNKKYVAWLFAPDGESVADCYSESIEEARERIENIGSRWIFYPMVAIADGEKIVEVYAPLHDGLVGMTRKEAGAYIAVNAQVASVPSYHEEIVVN